MTFDEWWYKYGIEIDIPKNEACVIWMAALNNAEALKPSHNSAMDVMCAHHSVGYNCGFGIHEWCGKNPCACSPRTLRQ